MKAKSIRRTASDEFIRPVARGPHPNIGEMRLLEHFKSDRDHLLWQFASDEGPPDHDAVEWLATLQGAIEAVQGLIADGGFQPIGGTKPTTPFMIIGDGETGVRLKKGKKR